MSRITFITICAVRPTQPFITGNMNRALIDALREGQSKDRCWIYTYCLMPDHLHYLVGPQIEGASVLVFTDRFKGRSTRLSWQLGWQGKLWQARFYDHIVREEEDLRAIAAYILGNPVRRGLVERTEDWPWSGHINPLPLNPAPK